MRKLVLAAAVVPIASLYAAVSAAQPEHTTALAERSSIVVAGKVLEVHASLEPLQAASERTVVIAISRTYLGAEIAGDQTGHEATIVLSSGAPSLKVGSEALFFGNPRFVGKTLTVADEGELPAGTPEADLKAGLQARLDVPVRERMALASHIFVGRVETERPLAATDEPSSEHDPEWHVAAVRVVKSLRGTEAGALVSVIFPASRDIMWFNAPKLRPGQEAILIAHPPDKEDTRLTRAPGAAAFLSKESAVVVSAPFDLLPAADEARMQDLLAKGR